MCCVVCSKKNQEKNDEVLGMDKIDFVVTWVDGNDPMWRNIKQQYEAKNADVRNARYRDWEQLRYWFRSIEKMLLG